jgi:4-hydroxy-tetrahydrodipicolinate reductase
MGKMVEAVSLARGHRIVTILDPLVCPGAAYEPEKADVLIEFSGPAAAVDNIKAAVMAGKAVVSGSTGWRERFPEVSDAVERAGTALLWASNFSLGVNLFYRIAAYAARQFDPFGDYRLGGLEVHHDRKLDSPSGTAKTLMERVLAARKQKERVRWDGPAAPPEAVSRDESIPRGEAAPGTIHFASLRCGSVPGTHSLYFDSPADTVEITHTARNREGFASGAVIAAEWLAGCSGPGTPAGAAFPGGRRGVFTMDDVLKDILP